MNAVKLACIGAVFGLGLAGCNSTGTLDPSTAAAVTNTFNAVCVGSPGNPPVISALAPFAGKMNAAQTNVYQAVQSMCAAGPPTTAYAATVDALITAGAINAAFPNLKIRF